MNVIMQKTLLKRFGRRSHPASSSLPTKPHCRVVVLGAGEVGKTCIISRFLRKKFENEYKATVEELHRGMYEIAGVTLALDILDTSGSFPFPAMRELSIMTGDAFILVYSVDDESSFEEVKSLRQQIIDQKGSDELTPIVIVGNKADLADEQRAIKRVLAETTVSIDGGHGYVEASAKNDTNIGVIFRELLRQLNGQLEGHLASVVSQRFASVPSHNKDLPHAGTASKLSRNRSSARS